MREVLLALVFAAAFFHQAVLPPDTLPCVMTDAQVEFADQASGAERGQRFAQLDQLRFPRRGRFVGLQMTRARLRQQSARALLLETAQPFANRGHGGGKQSRSGLDTALSSALDQPQTMVVGVFHLTHQIEIAGESSHDAAIVSVARCLALPPARQPSPFASSHSSIQLRQGDTM